MNPQNNPTASKSGRLLKTLALSAGVIASAATGSAQSFYTNSTGDFNVAASWSPNGVPSGTVNATDDNSSNNVVLIQPGDPVWGHGDTLAGQTDGSSGAYLQTGSTNDTGYPSSGNWLRLGIGTNSTGYYVLSNGVLNVAGRTQIGEKGTGYLEIDNGVYTTGYNGNPGIVAGQGDFGTSTGTLVINGGAVTNVNNETWFGEANSACTGYFFMNGGTFSVNNWFVFGRNGGNGFGTMTAGTLTLTGGGQFLVGGGGIGALAQSGGTINVFNQYLVPQSDGGVGGHGTNILSGTAVLNVHDWLAVGRNNGYGELDISGSAAITRDNSNDGGSHFDIGASANGVVNQNGGTITESTSDLYIGESGAGTWNFNSGTALLQKVVMCVNSSASAQLSLNGGLFQTTGFSSPTAGTTVSLLSLNGATLQANANNPAFISGLTQVSIGAGGVTLDSQGFNIAIPEAVTDAGGGTLTKIGSGTVTLTAANSYAGTTAVNAGTLATTTASTGGGGYSVGNGATLNLQVVGSLNSQLKMSSLSFASSATTLGIDLNSFGNPSSAPVNVSGALTVAGTVTINISDELPQVGQFPLISYSLKTGSSYVLGSIPFGVVASLVDNTANHSIDLNVTAVNLPRWDGNAGGNWDVDVTTNWVNIGTGLPTYYLQGNAVTFDDNATGTTAVNLIAAVTPASVTLNNNSLNYTLAGSGSINGATGISKQGTGNFSINNANGYTGATTIANGTLSVNNLANGGSSSAIGASSANPSNLVLAGGNLVYTGPATAINRGYSTTSTNSAITISNNLTLSGLVTAADAGGLTKLGSAQLTYATAGSNVLSGASSTGFIVEDGAVVFDGSSGGQTNLIQGARLGVDGVTELATVTLTNVTIDASGIDVGNIAGSTGVLNVNNGATLNLGSWLIFGDGGNVVSTLNLNNGTLNVNNGKVLMGGRPGDNSTLNINGGFLNNAGGQAFDIGDGGWNGSGERTATVNQSGGTNNVNNGMYVGYVAGGTGFYNLTNGALITTGEVDVGNGGGVGTLNIVGGSVDVHNWFTVGRDGSVGCIVNMTGGLFTQDSNGNIDIATGAGDNSAVSVGTFNQSGGILNAMDEYWIGENNAAVGTNNISGTAAVNVSSYVTVGRGGIGVGNFSSGTFNQTGGNPFIVGIYAGSTGIWNQTGGALTTGADIWIAQGDLNAHGTITLSGGSITNNGWLAVGREGGSGVFNINGGTYVRQNSADNVSIAHGGGTGTVNVNSGLIDTSAGQTWIGEDSNTGTWNMNGGTAILSLINIAENASANGVLALNGGSLTATEITTGNTGAVQRELDFNGGTLVAGGDNTNFINNLSVANVQSGGAVFNTAGHSVSVNQALLGATADGGLTKIGNGTLYLNGVNTYTNATLVNAGALGGAGTILGPVAVSSAAKLAPGTASIGTLTISNSLALASGSATTVKISMDGGATNDAVTGLSSVSYAGSLIVSNIGVSSLVSGTQFHLFNAATSSGNFSSVTVLPAGAGTFNPATGVLTITSSGIFAFNPVKLSGGNLILTGTGGQAGGGYTLLTSTNIATPMSAWVTNTTGTLDQSGAFSNAIPVSSSQPTQFFRVRTP